MTKKEKIVEYLDQMNGLIEKIGELVICDEVKEEQPFKIISVFRPSDRLDELDKIPEMPNGGINYREASQLLCEKDGGRLPTMKELAQFASYIYGEHIPPYANVDNLKVKQMREELQKFEMPFFVWSSEEYSSNYAYARGFHSGFTSYGNGYRVGSDLLAVCLGD